MSGSNDETAIEVALEKTASTPSITVTINATPTATTPRPTNNQEEEVEEDAEADEEEAAEAETFHRPTYILPLIVAAQFAGTSLWFAGNAVLPDLVDEWEDEGVNIPDSARGYLTSVVQLGFIVGTLLSALLNLADRFRPTHVFMWSALVGAIFNALIPFWKSTVGLVLFRFGTGLSLAGIYPVGMKVAADWFPSGLGRALGWLVGALAVGSATPFLLNQINQPWQALLWETSGLAVLGGIAVGLLVPDGPCRKPGAKLDPSVVWTMFRDPPFRAAALAYVGHMWELYAFWTWCVVVWEAYILTQEGLSWGASAITFGVLAIGGVGCVVGGILSETYGSALVAFASLATSGLMCLLSPALYITPPVVMLIAYLIWGMAVVADSPQFSSLVATTAPAANKGTALTIVNCIGFTITIGSIQLLSVPLPEQYLFLLLAPGPALGLWWMRALAFPDIFSSAAKETSGLSVIGESGNKESEKEESNAAPVDDVA